VQLNALRLQKQEWDRKIQLNLQKLLKKDGVSAVLNKVADLKTQLAKKEEEMHSVRAELKNYNQQLDPLFSWIKRFRKMQKK